MKKRVTKKIHTISDTLASRYRPEKVILFGSHAWGVPHSDSDVDLLIIKKTRQKFIDRDEIVRKLLWDVKTPVDIMIYTPRELKNAIRDDRNLFINHVIQNGIPIYEKNSVRTAMD